MAGDQQVVRASDKIEDGDRGAGKSENLNPERAVTGAQVKEAESANPDRFVCMTDMPALSAPLTPGEKQAARAFDSVGLVMDIREVLTGRGLQPPDAPPAGSAEHTGTVTDYRPVKTGDDSYALGINWEQGPDQRTPAEKLTDLVQAAAARATDSGGWQKYIDGQVEKFLGIGEGLNIAKEQTKEAVVAGWAALTDGTVANFLAKPNALNDPLFHAVGSAFDAMANDPNAVNHALEHLGAAVMEGSERYAVAPDREKGKIIGETMFFMVNPEGSTEAGEAALRVADSVATHVDNAVMDGIRASVRAAEDMAAASPELAEQARRMFYDYTRKLGLSPQEMESAGIPKGYFDGVEGAGNKGNHYFAMSGGDDLHSGVESMPKRPERKVDADFEQGRVEGAKMAESIAEHVRWVEDSEDVEQVFQEMGSLSKEHGLEYGLVKTEDGRLEMVKGGPDRITFFPNPHEVIAHTHVTGGLEPSNFDMTIMEALEQKSMIIIDANTGKAKVVEL